MKTRLNIRQVKECLLHYKTITSVEEMCAILNVDVDKIPKEHYEGAAKLIERNRLRAQVNLKQELYNKQDPKSKEQLYKMICDESELKRFGIKTADSTVVNSTPTIEIKCADPDIIDKIKSL